MPQKLKLWLYGLFVAVVSAIGDAGTVAIGAMVCGPGLLHQHDFWNSLGGMLAFSAIKTVFAYMKQSPIPRPDSKG